MQTSAAGRSFIESFEGLFLQAYDDADDRIVKPGHRVYGTLTIGYGHTDEAGPPRVYVGQTITKEEADAILASDLQAVEIEVCHLVKVPLSQHQFDALVSFQFNTGCLGHSSILELLNRGELQSAASHFALYNHYKGRTLNGLTRRREAETVMFEHGIYPNE